MEEATTETAENTAPEGAEVSQDDAAAAGPGDDTAEAPNPRADEPADDANGDGDDALSLEDATKALKKARAEAARYRTQRNELKQAAEEAEGLRARVAELEAERDNALAEARESTRHSIAAAAGVPVEFVTGDTPEAMQEVAGKLAAWRGERDTPRVPVVDAVGRESRPDRQSLARQVLGVT